MKALSWVRARPKTLASVAGVTAGVIAITTLALTYDGLPTTKVDLNDGGVWITKTSSMLVGHFNNESTVLDGGARNVGEDFDILQDAENVVVVDDGASTVTAVDPARVAFGDAAGVPGNAKVALGDQTVAILDPKAGDLWVVPMKGIASFEIEAVEPTVELGKAADVAVGRDGTVYGLSSARGEVVTIPVDNEGQPLESSTASVGEIEGKGEPTITVVGTTPIVLDPAAGVVTTPGGFRTRIDRAADALLQHASAESDAVALATPTELIRVPLDGGEPARTPAGGEGAPAAPVSLTGCTYGAWAGSAKFLRECPGEENDVAGDVKGAEKSSSLTFRVNRDVIILNDAVGGAAWLANESLQRVDNWNDLTPPEGETENQEDSTEEAVETTLPERSEVNTPPVAEDDTFGVRPGASTMLPVLDNDNDPDGDVLVAAVLGRQPQIGTVQPIFNGGSLQIAVDEKATGSATFEYEIDDGREGRDTGSVTLQVHDWDQNDGPRSKRKTSLAVESGGTISYNILPDWIDPDGDDIYLKNVEPAPGDEVDFSKDGQLTYKATASLQGRKEVQVTVADALGELGSATIALDVRPQGSTEPKTNADHVTTRAGEQIIIAPLTNDTSTGREPLRLSRVLDVDGATIQPDFQNKSFSFVAEKPAVYYVQYQVTTGPKNGEGLVRIDVLPETESDLPPVAVRDVALLPTGGDVLLGVLNNDTDPAGGILVVQSVSVPPSSGISVSVLNHETLRITDQGALDEQVRIAYRISNGTKSAEGEVVVVPIPAAEEILQPVAVPDTATVRVGDVVTIPVLANDVHPSDDALHVEPELIEPFVDPADGEAFVSQDAVRFRAGAEPKTVYLTYEVSDSRQQKAAGYVTIQILPLDAETNAAPRPHDLVSRTLAGSEANVAVPLDGIDADGDSVELIGIDSSPSKGRITTIGPNYFTYEASEGASGVDTFTYRVQDRLGKEGVGTIRVGIAPSEQVNQAPYAVKDAVVVRPGREIAVPVLANDSDPEGDKLSLVKKGLEVPKDLQARVSGDRVLIEVPNRAMETSVQYTVSDARGATATATIQVTVDEDVPLQAPVARDDRLQPADLADGGLTADLAILENDEDPDGTTDRLEVEVGEGATLLGNGKARVTVAEERQLIRYTLTDVDGQAASAFLFVPGKKELRPTLTSTKPVDVVSGETVTLPLSEYVTVAGGGEVRITEKAKVAALHANGADLLKDASTLVYTSADRYFGPDSLTFEVTDGEGPDDPDGRKATLSIPINVLPPANQQPTFVRGEVSVAPGEAATSLDLAALTDDPDPEDDHSYTLVGGEGKGVTARIEGGSRLLVEAASNAKKGTALDLTVRVSDGETDPVEGTVRVVISASTRTMPAASTDTVPEADAGETITVRPLENDFNPFPDTPLKIVTAVLESGSGQVSMNGDEVAITPAKGFVGTIIVRYRIQDATEDADREVNGQIVVTVQDVPDAPGVPTITSVQDRKVVLSYSAPANNGTPITKYTVSAVKGGSYSRDCSSTTCTLDGLTNNVEYVFQVTATNRVGESAPSPASEPARPDARPDKPQPPTLEFGDKSLKVSWKTPSTPGSPVERYTLEINPVPPSGISQKEVTGNSMTWEGLENGSGYQVRVQAHNRAPQPSSWSEFSDVEVPAGPPFAPGTPTTRELEPVGDQAQMEVTWSAPKNNGATVDAYRLEVLSGGKVVDTKTPGAQQTSMAIVVPTSETAYTYRIRAHNKAGWGDFSGESAPRRGVVAPGAPTGMRIVQELDRALEFEFTPGSRNGARAEEMRFEVRLNNGPWTPYQGNIRVISGLTNGVDYAVEVRMVSVVDGVEYAGPPSNSATGNPHGTPHTPAAGAEQLARQVKLSWNASGSANGRQIQVVQISIDGGPWENVGIDGSRSVGDGYDQPHSIRVKAMDTTQQWSAEASASAKSGPAPEPKIWVEKGGTGASCNNGPCLKFFVHWTDAPLGQRQVWCSSDRDATIGTQPQDLNFSSANGSKELDCWQGQDNVNVWVNVVGWGDEVDTEKRFWEIP